MTELTPSMRTVSGSGRSFAKETWRGRGANLFGDQHPFHGIELSRKGSAAVKLEPE